MNKPRLIDAELVGRNLIRHKTAGLQGESKEMENRMLGFDVRGFLKGFEYGMELATRLVAYQPTAYDIDKVVEMEDYIKELEAITGLMQKRTYYRKFIDEVWKKQEGKELSEPDFDYIYKLYFELIEARDKVVEQLETLQDFEERTGKGYCPDRDTECRYMYSDLGCGHCAFEKAIEIVKGGGSDGSSTKVL